MSITIELNEATLRNAEARAAACGLSLEQVLQEVLTATFVPKRPHVPVPTVPGEPAVEIEWAKPGDMFDWPLERPWTFLT